MRGYLLKCWRLLLPEIKKKLKTKIHAIRSEIQK